MSTDAPARTLSPSEVPDPRSAPGLSWGILGPGGIAHTFARAVHEGTASRVVAVGSRSAERGSAFAAAHGIPTAHDSYAALVADPRVEAVYVATPHSEHHDHALLALRAGKPVLVEKAFTRSLAEADEVFAAADAAGVLAAEAMWARYLPHYDVVRRTIAAGTIGAVVLLMAEHSQLLWPNGPQRLRDPALAGGSLLDLGVYPIALADHLLGGLDEVHAAGDLTPEGVDATVTLTARGRSGGRALLSSTMAAAGRNAATVVGRRGRIEVHGWFYQPTRVDLFDADGTLVDSVMPAPAENGFRYEAAEFARAVRGGASEVLSVPREATRRVLEVMDEVRRQLGVVYPGEGAAR